MKRMKTGLNGSEQIEKKFYFLSDPLHPFYPFNP